MPPSCDFAAIEALQRHWTDRLVRARPGVPDLARFAGRVGRVVTVNFGGRAVVDWATGPWVDVEIAHLEEADAAARASYDGSVNSAQPIPSKQG